MMNDCQLCKEDNSWWNLLPKIKGRNKLTSERLKYEVLTAAWSVVLQIIVTLKMEDTFLRNFGIHLQVRHSGAKWECMYSSYLFLTSALDGAEWSASHTGEWTRCTHWIWGWVGLRAGMDTEAKEKLLCLCWISNLGRPICIYYTDWNTLYMLGIPTRIQTAQNTTIDIKSKYVLWVGAGKRTGRSKLITSIKSEGKRVAGLYYKGLFGGGFLTPPGWWFGARHLQVPSSV
jgi:hypothetical protein